jgi:hypothetical protein
VRGWNLPLLSFVIEFLSADFLSRFQATFSLIGGMIVYPAGHPPHYDFPLARIENLFYNKSVPAYPPCMDF